MSGGDKIRKAWSWGNSRPRHEYEVWRVGRDGWEPCDSKDARLALTSHQILKLLKGSTETSEHGSRYRVKPP